MLLTFQTGLFQLGDAFDIELGLPLGAVAIIFVTLVPLALLFGSLFLGVALRSRSFKEAQNALTPIYLAVNCPGIAPSIPRHRLHHCSGGRARGGGGALLSRVDDGQPGRGAFTRHHIDDTALGMGRTCPCSGVVR